MFEHKSVPLLSRTQFLRRMAAALGVSLAVLAISLSVGMVGYHRIEGLAWIDAFLNASMLLGGMGPMEHERSVSGKLFEGLYALYCGLAIISVAGIILTPVVHRIMHKLHADIPDDENTSR